MLFKELLPLLGVIPIIFSQREEQDSSCDGASECLPASQCDSYMDESEKLKNLQKRTQEYNKLLTKLRGLVCNKKQKKICCSDTDDGPTILCGSRSDDTDEARISGGETVYPGKYPWMAAIFEDGKMHCGGTLISNRHVLTAAHCVIDMGKRETKTEFDIRLGETDLKTKYDCRLQDISRCQDSEICYQRGNCAEPHISRGAKSVHVNPNYKVDDIHNNDLAVITLDRRVVFSNTVVAVCLPTPSQTTKLLELSPHSLLFVSGWGKMSNDGPLATVLQELQVNWICNFLLSQSQPSTGYLCSTRRLFQLFLATGKPKDLVLLFMGD